MDNASSALDQPPPAYTASDEAGAGDQFTTNICTSEGKKITLGINLNLTNTPLGPTVTPHSVSYGPGQAALMQSPTTVTQQTLQQQSSSGVPVYSYERRKPPVGVLRMLGIIQVILGGVCVLFGSIHIGLVSKSQYRQYYQYNGYDSYSYYPYRNHGLYGFTFSASPIWCGLWFVLTGAFGIAASKCRPEKRRCYKITFMVTSILSAIPFGLTTFILSIVTGVMDHLSYSSYRWLLPWFLVILTFIEIVVAICSASYCCCCSRISQRENSEAAVVDGRGVTYRVA